MLHLLCRPIVVLMCRPIGHNFVYTLLTNYYSVYMATRSILNAVEFCLLIKFFSMSTVVKKTRRMLNSCFIWVPCFIIIQLLYLKYLLNCIAYISSHSVFLYLCPPIQTLLQGCRYYLWDETECWQNCISLLQ